MKDKLLTLYNLELKVLEWLKSPFLLAVRVFWGWQFIVAGKGKLVNPDQYAEFFKNWGIPAPKLNVIMAGSTETFGGILLILGLGSRIITIPLAVTMIVALMTAHRGDVGELVFKLDADKFLAATPLTFLMASLIVLIFGPGAYSADHLLGKRLAPTPAPKKD